MPKLIDITGGPVIDVLDLLLQDKSTKKNIIWATDTYEDLGHGFTDKEQIDQDLLLQHAEIIKPRIEKSIEAQQARTRKKAEVFTPVWLCNEMNNYCDEEWFGRKNVFNTAMEDHTWSEMDRPIQFPRRKRWQSYVDSRRLEITCGEAPFLVSRYDVASGTKIEPLRHRIGQLDRKLRIVNENTTTRGEWVAWSIRAIEASYGYEYQGDNLLIARVNVLLTFFDYYRRRWREDPDARLLKRIANKIAWNIWQMDGLKDTVPLGKPYEEFHQLSLADLYEDMAGTKMSEPDAVLCRIRNWRSKETVTYRSLKGE